MAGTYDFFKSELTVWYPQPHGKPHDVTAAASVADHLWLMGRDHDPQGNPLPGSHIVETYDLIERDLCWHPEIITHPRFGEFVREVKDRFRSL